MYSSTFDLRADMPDAWIVEYMRWRRPLRCLVTIHPAAIEKRDPVDLLVAACALSPQHTFVWRSPNPRALQLYVEDLTAAEMADDHARITAAVARAFAAAKTDWGRCGSTSTEITTIVGSDDWALKGWPLPNVKIEG